MYDIAVIGGGPAGLSAAVQVRARNRSVLVVSGDDRDNPVYRSQHIANCPIRGGRSCWPASRPTRTPWGSGGGRAGY